jgi:ubiquinone/menaquinone biosynthesis C-methylase UbiE
MSRPFYSARGIHVEMYTYRTEIRENPVIAGDLDFYLERTRESGGPVLELACGNGRIALPLARAGFETTGIDLSEPMLGVAKARRAAEPEPVRHRLTLLRGDMSDFNLGSTFRTVIIAFRSFQLLTTPEDQRACLEAVRRHMEPGGRLLIDIFDPLLERLSPGPSEDASRPLDRARDPNSGNWIQVETVRRDNDTVRQILREVWRFTERDDRGLILRQEEEVLTMRWIYRWEMRYLLELCGFEVEAEYSDYAGSPPAYGREQIYVARAI